jgi:hypothetical protein
MNSLLFGIFLIVFGIIYICWYFIEQRGELAEDIDDSIKI